MTVYATPADVEHERTADDPEWSDQRVATLLEDAHDLAGLGRDLPARIADGRTTPGLVRRALLEVVTAALRNPAGLRSTSRTETAGPYSSAGFVAYARDGRLSFTPAQRLMLGDRRPAIRTAAPGRPHLPETPCP